MGSDESGDVFLMPSWAEDPSSQWLAALAVGLPVQASRITGEDLIDREQNGVLLSRDHPCWLTWTLLGLHHESRLREAIRRRVRMTVEEGPRPDQDRRYIEPHEELVPRSHTRFSATGRM